MCYHPVTQISLTFLFFCSKKNLTCITNIWKNIYQCQWVFSFLFISCYTALFLLIQVLDLESLSRCHLKFTSTIPHSSALKYIFLRGRYFATWSVFLTQFNCISYPIIFWSTETISVIIGPLSHYICDLRNLYLE